MNPKYILKNKTDENSLIRSKSTIKPIIHTKIPSNRKSNSTINLIDDPFSKIKPQRLSIASLFSSYKSNKRLCPIFYPNKPISQAKDQLPMIRPKFSGLIRRQMTRAILSKNKSFSIIKKSNTMI